MDLRRMLLPAIYVGITCISCTLFVPVDATADPEKSYQAGKAMSDSVTGGNTRNLDDRGFEERMADAMKDAGRRAGGGESKGGAKDSGGKDSGGKDSGGKDSSGGGGSRPEKK